MSNMSEQPRYIQERYGYKQPRRFTRIATYAIIGIVIIASYVIYQKRSVHDVTFRLTSFSAATAHSVSVTWQVARPLNTTIYCVLRAQDDKRIDVGYATVTVAPANTQESNITYTLSTDGTPVLAEVLGCASTRSQHVPPPDFPPGVQIPAQLAPGVAPTP